jgi:hypothetical protein
MKKKENMAKSAAFQWGPYLTFHDTDEGWCISNGEDGYEEIQKQDHLDKFESDAAAYAYVRAKAEAGSADHVWALNYVLKHGRPNGPYHGPY